MQPFFSEKDVDIKCWYVVLINMAVIYSIFPHNHKGTIFKKKSYEHEMCVLILSTTFV